MKKYLFLALVLPMFFVLSSCDKDDKDKVVEPGANISTFTQEQKDLLDRIFPDATRTLGIYDDKLNSVLYADQAVTYVFSLSQDKTVVCLKINRQESIETAHNRLVQNINVEVYYDVVFMEESKVVLLNPKVVNNVFYENYVSKDNMADSYENMTVFFNSVPQGSKMSFTYLTNGASEVISYNVNSVGSFFYI